MAGAREEGDGEKKSAFRWLDAARYVVSALVVVMIVSVAAKAIMVVLRPDKLNLSVQGSSVYTERFPSQVEGGDKLKFTFNLHGENPSGRVRMYFCNISAYIFDNSTPPATTPSPMNDAAIFFQLEDMSVLQRQYVDNIKHSINMTRDPMYMVPSFFDTLIKPGSRIEDATMRVDGTLVTEFSSGHNSTPKPTSYYCRKLVVGVNLDDKASTSSEASTCITV